MVCKTMYSGSNPLDTSKDLNRKIEVFFMKSFYEIKFQKTMFKPIIFNCVLGVYNKF
jgi:hypothetical protein